jgi:DNA invertase Pin-like site-specific DNA recombinase
MQANSGLGLEAQRAAIEDECKRRGWELVRIESDVLSGRSMKRPGLQRALDACRSGEVAGIVVSKLDRLSRSLIDFAGLLAEAQAKSFNVVALDLGIDLSTPHGEFLASVMASAAQWERRIIGQRIREALAVKKAQGVKLGRPRLLPAKVRTRIKRLHGRGVSMQEIARRLNAEGVPTAHGGARWHASTVRAVLRSG